jgi:hypothetical protein
MSPSCKQQLLAKNTQNSCCQRLGFSPNVRADAPFGAGAARLLSAPNKRTKTTMCGGNYESE